MSEIICPEPADCCRELHRVWSALGVSEYNGKSASENVAALVAERARLRAALAALVGASTKDELEALEIGMRLMPAPAEDKAAAIDAVHALLATL